MNLLRGISKRSGCFLPSSIRVHFPVAGFSLIQMTATLSIIGILSAIGIPSFNFGTDPLKDTGNRLKGQIKLARTKALSTTTAVRLKPLANNLIEVQQHLPAPGAALSTCQNAALEVDASSNPLWSRLKGFSTEDFGFDEGIELTAVQINGSNVPTLTNWEFCFNSRGLSNENLVLELTDASQGKSLTLEVFPAGGIRITP